MMTTFILCAGDGERWNDYLGVPKQLVSFGGETLLARVRRLADQTIDGRVVIVLRQFQLPGGDPETLVLSSTSCIAESILATRPLWSERNTFLMGDVFYSRAALGRILGFRGKLAFFGRPWPSAIVRCGHGELFGVSFALDASMRVVALLEETVQARVHGHQGNLWNVYQLASNIPFGSRVTTPEHLVLIDDYTNDIDTSEDYRRRAELYERIARSQTGFARTGKNLGTPRPRHLTRLSNVFNLLNHSPHATVFDAERCRYVDGRGAWLIGQI